VTLNTDQQARLAPPYAGDVPAKPWQHLALAGSGALHSTAADMLKFTQALGRPADSPLKAAIELIELPRGDGKYGLGLPILKIKGQPGYWYSGGTGGFCSWISVRPELNRIVVLLINNNALSPESIISGASAKPPATDLADYVGDFDTSVKAQGRTVYYHFEARGSDLWMQITGQAPIALKRHPTQEDRFIFAPAKAEIQFTRKDGKVAATTLFQQGLEINATKVKP
jgi:CubicO group peptidase (beta-lactamase class C family)